MKYSEPHWGNLIKEELKKYKISQRKIARQLGVSESAFYKRIARKGWSSDSVREISLVLGKDLMVEFVSNESKVLLERALQAGLDDESQLRKAQEESEEKKALKLENALLGEKMAQMEVKYLKKLAEKEEEIKALKERL